jgi:hypothetical protein
MPQDRDPFNPTGWCGDMDGAIWKKITEVFNNRQKLLLERMCFCLTHFYRNRDQLLHRIANTEVRDKAKKLINDWVKGTELSEVEYLF